MCLGSPARSGASTSSAAVAANPQPGSWRRAMRRVISVWFPTFPIDRLQRIGAGPPDGGPFVTSMHDGRRRIVTAAGAAAQAIGILPGMPLANAQALVPALGISEAEPDADATALTQLAVWCLRYAPLVAA